jgi:2-dehydropantoate 2-reductase
MKIVIFGAGAIGSLFGALLAKKNTVMIVGRTPHITSIKHKGLTITGKTNLTVNVPAVESTKEITLSPDLILLTVKSYDTKAASSQISTILHEKTLVVSLQNGLDNIEKMEQHIEKKQILAGVTTHGAFFSEPGVIIHTGMGTTILGELDGRPSTRIKKISDVFNKVRIETKISNDITSELWRKAIINSSINPLTAFLGCNNGYLLQNPLLEEIVERVCRESSMIAQANGIQVAPLEMINRTKEVIQQTAQNSSSMLQSIQQGKKTEIDSINGVLVRVGMEKNIETPLNRMLIELVTS